LYKKMLGAIQFMDFFLLIQSKRVFQGILFSLRHHQ
jgi:hypothetical protein